jgi:hypothetical protein
LDPTKLQALRGLPALRGNRHLNTATIPPTTSDKHGSNAVRMRYVERAAQCLVACSTALDSEILVFALTIRNHLAGIPRDKFTNLFAEQVKETAPPGVKRKKKTAPLDPDKPFVSLGSRHLHRLAKAVCNERGIQPEWPADSHDMIAEPRNAIVHRSNYLVRDTTGKLWIRLLEDEVPRDLETKVENSLDCLLACFAALKCLRAITDTWKKIDMDEVTRLVAAS